MTHSHVHPKGSVSDVVKKTIEEALPEGALVDVKGAGGHYTIAVVSSVFAGKGMLECHRLVLQSIAPLMKGDDAPVHAVDSLTTKTP